MSIKDQSEQMAAVDSATRAFRDHVLAQEWHSSARIAELLDRRASVNPKEFASRLRRERKLWGIWNGREFQYPVWQLTSTGLDPRIARLLAALSAPDTDRDGWERASWLYTGKETLKDATPVAVWPTDPEAVIVAAEDEFGKASDGAT